MNGKKFCLERALLAASLFEDERPKDYAAFRSAFRGTEKNRVQSTLCTLWRCEILHEGRETLPSWEQPQKVIEHVRHGSRLVKCDSSSHQFSFSPQTFTVVITGDRFLYKMVRNIVGTIVAVACGHLELDVVRVAINSGRWDGGNSMELEDDLDTANEDDDYTTISNDKSHTIRRICAPGRGLVLHEVLYPDSIGFDWISG